MKKKVVLYGAIAAALVMAVVFLGNRGGDVRNVERIHTESTLYDREDIDTCMDIAIKTFSDGFEGCKMLSIAYDEEETLAEIERQRERHGELKLMVLKSSFYAGKNAEGSLNPDMTYMGWKWILQDADDGWKMINWGYA